MGAVGRPGAGGRGWVCEGGGGKRIAVLDYLKFIGVHRVSFEFEFGIRQCFYTCYLNSAFLGNDWNLCFCYVFYNPFASGA